MINFNKLLTPALTVYCQEKTSKKRILELISKLAAEQTNNTMPLNYKTIMHILQQREQLGSTTMGNGAAIPHGHVPNLEKPICVLVTLREPIEFDPDEKTQVDIVIGLLVPAEDNEQHLEILSSIAHAFKSPDFCQKLREAKSSQVLYERAIGNDNKESL